MSLEIKGVSKLYNKKEVLYRIDTLIPQGMIYGLLGENGAGKTTLMKTIVKLTSFNEGKIIVDGIDIQDNNSYLKSVGSLIETPIFYDNLTVYENLEISCLYKEADLKDIYRILDLVKLKESAFKKTKDLSLGMKQRLGIGRALIGNPQILILDEPINGLDPKGIKDMRKLFLQLSKKGVTVLISTHILSELKSIADKIGFMHKGTLVNEINVADELDLEKTYLQII